MSAELERLNTAELVAEEEAQGELAVLPDRNPVLVYLASLAPTGRRAMRSKLEQVSQLLGFPDLLSVPWQSLRYQHVVALRSKLIELGAAPATVNATLAAVRGVARQAYRLGLMSSDDYYRLREVPAARGERLPAGRLLTHGELAALLEACASDPSPAGVRDAAMIGLMYTGGLRRNEVPALDVDDYNAETGTVRVRGKGNKERLVYANNGAAEAISDWLSVRGKAPGPLFLPVNKGGCMEKRRLSNQAVYNALAKRAAEAGVKRFSPHDLRRTFISDLLDAGADIATVQRLAGHANVSTTQRYDRRPEEAKRRAARLLHLPYKGRTQAHPAMSTEGSYRQLGMWEEARESR